MVQFLRVVCQLLSKLSSGLRDERRGDIGFVVVFTISRFV